MPLHMLVSPLRRLFNMAIVSLGSRPMIIGANPIAFDPFPFQEKEAYCIFNEFSIQNPNNIFSYVSIKCLLIIPGLPNFFASTGIELEISQGRGCFFYPFSTLYTNDGTATFIAQRVPKIRGSAESDSPVDLELFYDDDISTRSWFL